MRSLIALAGVLALGLAGSGLAQHSHGTGEAFVVIAHDAPPDGRAVVGNPAHFAAILFGADGMPAFHHNMEIAVELNGVPLFATTPSSGHDYDGINGFEVVFPVPGEYVVRARTEGRDETATEFRGRVEPLGDPAPASLRLEGPEAVPAHEPAEFRYAIVDAAGVPVPDADVLFQIRRLSDGALVFRAHTHGHDGPQSLTYDFSRPGEYEVTLLAYQAFPDETAVVFPAFTTTKKVTVDFSPAGLADGAQPPTPGAPERRGLNHVTMGESAGDLVLMGTYDPYTVTGPFGQARLSAVVVDQDVQPVPRVDFEAVLTDPLGREVFRSASLHEYDGVLEVLFGGQEPGPYSLHVEAQRGAWTGSLVLDYTVAPPATPLSAGPQFLEATGLDQLAAGRPGEVELFMHDAAGRPFEHSEVDVQVVPAGEDAVPVLATKLHTHDDGRFPFTLAVHEPGDYVLRLAPFSLEPRPTPAYHGKALGDPLDLAFTVGVGPGLPGAEPLQPTSGPGLSRSPGLEPLALLGALALVAMLARRR